MALSKGAGTQTSPIAIEDSEDEVLHELCDRSSQSPASHHSQSQQVPNDKKRKRANSDASENAPVAGPSRPQPALGTRLSNPTGVETKKARKRRRKQERQQQETQERLRHLHATAPPYIPLETLQAMTPWNPQAHPSLPIPVWHGPKPTFYHPIAAALLQDEYSAPQHISSLHGEELLHLPSHSDWVFSMAQDQGNQTQILKPEKQAPASLPLTGINTSSTTHHQSRASANYDGSASSVTEPTSTSPTGAVHALPPKPPPQVAQIIGMKPDQDPNSKHGIFHIPVPSQDATTGSKKKPYIPNPACTLVMEQLPKTHRTGDFINTWSKKACGVLPVHLSIDGQGGKALIEFATAELARKAWGSPKLGSKYAGLKSHQLKGKPREDLIKVWWYRVDGVGAGSGVGEIEEGEIEGDAGEKELDMPQKKETKKERKARLAKEREEKRLKRERDLRTQQEAQLGVLSVQGDPRSVMMNSGPSTTIPKAGIPPNGPAHNLLPPRPLPHRSPYHTTWNPSLQQINGSGVYADKASYGSSILPDINGCDSESIASSRGSSVPPDQMEYRIASNHANEDMEVDDDDMDLASPTIGIPPVVPGPSSSHLPPAVYYQPRAYPPAAPSSQSVVKANQKIWKPAPVLARNVPVMPSLRAHSHTSTTSSTPSTTPSQAPSEPRAMKNAPTEPSYVKRLQSSRHKELEERIAKGKLELEQRTLAAKVSSETSSNDQLVPTPTAPVSRTGSPVTEKEPSPADKQAMEDTLRALVLKSQRARTRTGLHNLLSIVEPPAVLHTEPSQQIVPSSTPSHSQNDPFPSLSVNSHSFSLEDLAVSFITQTIETLKPQGQDLAPPPHLPRAGVKTELAAKQKRLEQQIAESKELMAQFSQARTKQEKDSIMALLKEKSRLMEPENEATSTVPSSASSVAGSNTPPAVFAREPVKSRWPVSHHDAGVLIVSDDEDEDED